MEQTERTLVERGPRGDLIITRHASNGDGNFLLYAGASPDTADRPVPVVRTSASSVTVSGLDPSRRHYFRIVPPDGPAETVAERILPLTGAPNFRDLGGYPTSCGRRVKWGRLFRSGDLSELTPGDLAYLATLDLKTVFDLRSFREIENQQNRLPEAHPPETVHLPIYDEKADPYFIRQQILAGNPDGLDSEKFLTEFNENLVTGFIPEISAFLKALGDPDALPAVVHCSIGKDRTGFLSAAVLLALGVPLEIVLYDYELTNVFTSKVFEAVRPLFEQGAETIGLFLQARREYLTAALDTINTQYGSFGTYLSEALAITERDLEHLREALLE